MCLYLCALTYECVSEWHAMLCNGNDAQEINWSMAIHKCKACVYVYVCVLAVMHENITSL